MQILVTGGTGFIGSALLPALLEQGHEVIVLTRQQLVGDDRCRYIRNLQDIPNSASIDAIINLAGASLADKRWSDAYKREIFDSRLQTTGAVLELIARLDTAPAVMLSASAIGYYGHHGDERLDENGASEPGFSQSLCEQWESLAQQAASRDVRVCLLRLGVVLDAGGGAFEQMAQPFRFGVGNWLGDGQQWLSWIHRTDVIAAILYLLSEPVAGPVNLTAPEPVTSRGFCEAMQRRRRTLISLPMPAVVMRALVGEMADELLLKGQRVVPAALEQRGFEFRYPDIDAALADICGR